MRAWELLSEFVKAVNTVEDYTGDEDALDVITNENLPEADDTDAEDFSLTS